MKLSKAQRETIEQRLSHPYGRAKLICDGHEVTLHVERSKGMTYRVMTYVDGEFRVAWVSAKEAHPQQKFMRKRVRRLYSPAAVAKAEKILGKRYVAKQPSYREAITTYAPDWASGRAALAHLCKVCESIEDVTDAPEAVTEATP